VSESANRPKHYTELQVQTVCLVIVTAFAIGMGLYLLRPVLVPFMLAVFLAFMLAPILDLQTRLLRIPRYLALFITVIVAIAVLSVGTGVTVSSITRLANDSDRFQAELETRTRDLVDRLPLESLGVKNKDEIDPMTFFPENIMQWVLTRLTAVLTTLASQGVLVLLFVIFLLLGRSPQPRPPDGVGPEIERSVKRYIITKVVVSALTGILVFMVLNILRVPYAMAFGALAFLLNFIPSVGSIVATLLPIPVLLLTPEISMTTFALAIVIPGTIQFSVGNLIEPKLMGDSLDLHPVVILLALIFWGMIWGPIGMLLAAPLTAITKIVLSKIELTQPLADALGGRVGGLLEFR
jgi:AI-2 transport protein TqsA